MSHSFKNHFTLTLGLFFLASLTPDSIWAETRYVKKSGTKVYKEASARSKVVELVGAGKELETSGIQGKFYKVITSSGRKGFVFKFKLGDSAPEKGGDLASLKGEKMAVRESSSSSSIRGLSPVSEQHAQKKGISKADIQAVKDMENYGVSASEVDRFLSSRKLGEYQE
ncbi:MAG: SH3 domain-containing protein [Candidatus Nitronauta litoralis]|uniref:SH3 domain-containing protein n=1 Tax=Candidatus Nitronauta litoralis TaxID=2705533 RepID=A0A7T0BXW2_9BACT|nr:MAG: SH3 domain-containing protein [Candidatus Nitronauta litoralis]